MDWKKQFIGMLFPLNRAELDIERAYLLKNKHLPKSIFKYRKINNNSIKNLEEDTIWLADPSNFNDPYDCAHTVDFTRIQKHQESVDFERLMEVKGHELNLSDEQKSKLLESQTPFTILTEMLLSSIDTDKKAFKKLHYQQCKENFIKI